MKRFLLIILTIALGLFFSGCASQRYARKAAKMEGVGQFIEAADLYYRAVEANNTNAEAYVGLKRTGQQTLNKKLSEFTKSYNQQDDKNGVYIYLDAKAYYEKIKRFNIELSFPSYYEDYYIEMKDAYLVQKYKSAVTYLENDEFDLAKKGFEEILKLSPEYKDSKSKLKTATYEPSYRSGISLMEKSKFRQAYYVFNNILKKTENYENSDELRSECLTKGTIVVGVKNVTCSASSDITSPLKAKVVNDLINTDNIFLKVVEYNANTKMDAVLYCDVPKYVYTKGSLKSEEKRGYSKKEVKYYDKESGQEKYKTEYTKVKYMEYYMYRSLQVTYSYTLKDFRSGSILVSETKSFVSSDEINYIKYEGTGKNLVAGYWKNKTTESKGDYISDNSISNSKIQSLLGGRREIKTYNTLLNSIINSGSSKITSAVDDYIKSN